MLFNLGVNTVYADWGYESNGDPVGNEPASPASPAPSSPAPAEVPGLHDGPLVDTSEGLRKQAASCFYEYTDIHNKIQTNAARATV